MIVSNSNTSLITIEEFSVRSNLHRNTVTRLVNQGIITGIRIGGSWRIDYAEAINNLKNQNARIRLPMKK
jgi:excisionase family DNA binding protein